MLIEDFMVFEIIKVLLHNDQYYFICKKYETVIFSHSLNAIKIIKAEREDYIQILKFCELKNKTSYEKKISADNVFIIAETLEVYSSF